MLSLVLSLGRNPISFGVWSSRMQALLSIPCGGDMYNCANGFSQSNVGRTLCRVTGIKWGTCDLCSLGLHRGWSFSVLEGCLLWHWQRLQRGPKRAQRGTKAAAPGHQWHPSCNHWDDKTEPKLSSQNFGVLALETLFHPPLLCFDYIATATGMWNSRKWWTLESEMIEFNSI